MAAAIIAPITVLMDIFHV
jgi:hypothetical protein